MNSFKAIVHGKVQGVFFRDSTVKQAKKLDLTGWVKNMSNGTVSLLAEGKDNQLKLFKDWLQKGSPLSKVEKVELKWIENTEDPFSDFKIVF
tara:strand:- start:91 stop:366 length:276 start_codon:yes stop_codon:yes gene_type:complete